MTMESFVFTCSMSKSFRRQYTHQQPREVCQIQDRQFSDPIQTTHISHIVGVEPTPIVTVAGVRTENSGVPNMAPLFGLG
jgi:hypothetical protein